MTEVRLVLGPSEVRGEEGPRETVPNGESSSRSGARCASQTRVPPTPGLGARAVAGWPRQCPRSLDREPSPNPARLAAGSSSPRGSELGAAWFSHCAPPFSERFGTKDRRGSSWGGKTATVLPQLFSGVTGSFLGVVGCCSRLRQCNPRVAGRTRLPARPHFAPLLLSLLTRI